MKIDFNEFKKEIKKYMYLDELSEEEIDEYMHEWYILFKMQGHEFVWQFVEWQFPKDEVNKDTHSFYKKYKK